MSFNYGLAEPALDSQNNPIYSKQVQQNIAVGTLPGLYFAPVEYEGQTYDPFYNVGWYKTKTKSEVSRVTSDTLYWYAHDAEIYALCDIYSYAVYYYVDGEHYSTASVKYGAEMQLPTLVRSGYTFDGWYKDSNYTNQFTGTMPPRSISLYARFILE